MFPYKRAWPRILCWFTHFNSKEILPLKIYIYIIYLLISLPLFRTHLFRITIVFNSNSQHSSICMDKDEILQFISMLINTGSPRHQKFILFFIELYNYQSMRIGFQKILKQKLSVSDTFSQDPLLWKCI